MNKQEATERLINLYNSKDKEEKIGLILGAGVSKDSGIPLYKELALVLFKKKLDELKSKNAPTEALNYLESLYGCSQVHENYFIIEPEKIIGFIKNYIDEKDFKNLMRDLLFQNCNRAKEEMELSRGQLASYIYRDNKTLDSIISFCAVKDEDPLLKNKFCWGVNPKIGGILTTNYDNLVEASFNTKYRAKLLKPVARDPMKKNTSKPDKYLNVFHMHGYVSYQKKKKDPQKVIASDLVIAENDYYLTFYNVKDYNNRKAKEFLCSYASIFIGCSMKDINLRRLLFEIQQGKASGKNVKEHYAILPSNNRTEDSFNEALLNRLHVNVIWVSNKEIGKEIEGILKQIYLSGEGIKPSFWDEVKKGGQIRKT